MTTEELFEKHEDEYLKFDRVLLPKSKCPDIHGFLLLESIFDGITESIIAAAEHDIVYLEVSIDMITQLNEENVIELLRCGILFSSEYDGLYINP